MDIKRTAYLAAVLVLISAPPVLAGPSFESGLYSWIKNDQTDAGLLPSYDGDPALTDVAFTYDQALAAQAFVLGGDNARAAKILGFFDSKAKAHEGLFFNAYDARTGSPWEYTVHAGPNLWIGISALQFARSTGDKRFVPLAARLGNALLALQKNDPEGGLRGGPDVTWFSTEHNIDALVFFGMLAEATKDPAFADAQNKARAWLARYAWQTATGAVSRGKNDGTAATDVYSWSVAGAGPAALESAGMDPSASMEHARKCCGVDAVFVRPGGGREAVKGFDFTDAARLDRKPVVSAEWTAQAALSCLILARYYENRQDAGRAVQFKQYADLYAANLEKMGLSSSAKEESIFLPYATMPEADTGHGWKTPAGAHTASLAGTAYTYFLKHGYNPLHNAPGTDAS